MELGQRQGSVHGKGTGKEHRGVHRRRYNRGQSPVNRGQSVRFSEPCAPSPWFVLFSYIIFLNLF